MSLKAASSFIMLAPTVNQVGTATGSAINLKTSNFTGPVLITQDVGAANGTLNGKIQDSADGSTGWADLTGAVFAEVSSSNQTAGITIMAEGTRGYIRYVGEVTVGAVAINVTGTGTPKYV